MMQSPGYAFLDFETTGFSGQHDRVVIGRVPQGLLDELDVLCVVADSAHELHSRQS